jgi:putative SOS response-associated peptidase YedK
MCGRYTHNPTWQQIVNLYRLALPDEEPPGLKPSWNVAPTHVMPIIRPAGNGRELVMAGWGLIPFWPKPDQLAKQPTARSTARAETIRTAPTYREPFKTKRCLVRATGGRSVTQRRSGRFTCAPRQRPLLSLASTICGRATARPSLILLSSRVAGSDADHGPRTSALTRTDRTHAAAQSSAIEESTPSDAWPKSSAAGTCQRL